MNLPAAIFSSIFGVAFFTLGSAYYYQPLLFHPDYVYDAIFSSEHGKARTAVLRLLINPMSAEFSVLRSVEIDTAKYVCGDVRANDRNDRYLGYRAFVYTVAIDSARIDDDGRIAQKHDAFSPCPTPEEEKDAQQKLAISPGAVSMLKTIQKVIPPADPATLTNLASQMPAGGERSSTGTMEQQLGELAGKSGLTEGSGSAGGPGSMGGSASKAGTGPKGGSGSAGQQQANSTFKAALDNESEWRSDRLPAAWPNLPWDHPLAKPAQKRTQVEALALAKDVEDRWEQSKSGNSKARPSSDEIKEACRALLAIDPKGEQFPKAWAAFVRLRKIDREAAS